MTSTGFQYHPAILERFPAICGGVMLVDQLSNGPTPPELWSSTRPSKGV